MGLLSKVRERKTNTYVFTCLCNLKTKINGQLQQNRNRLTDTGNKLVVTSREVGGRKSKRGEGD